MKEMEHLITRYSKFGRITKIDSVNRTVTGIFTNETPDKTKEVCDYNTTKPYYQEWSDEFAKATGGKSLGNVREMHSLSAVGKLVSIDYDDINKAISGTAKVVDDDAWKKCLEGVYTGFSQGGEYVKTWKDGANKRYTANPSEVSLVDNPCNPDATFEFVKADGSVELRKFVSGGLQKTSGEIEAKDVKGEPYTGYEDGAKGPFKCGNCNFSSEGTCHQPVMKEHSSLPRDKDGNVKIDPNGCCEYVDRIGSVSKTEEVEMTNDQVAEVVKSTVSEVLASLQVNKSTDPVQILLHPEEGQVADKCPTCNKPKAECECAAKAAVAKKKPCEDCGKEECECSDEVKAARSELEKRKADSKASKEPYGDVKYADPGFQEDKKKRYPLDTEEHIRAAWNYIHQEKNAGKYSAENASHIKDEIISAWKDKIDKDGPPSVEKTVGAVLVILSKAFEEKFKIPAKNSAILFEKCFSAKPDEMTKGMMTVQRLASLLINLAWLKNYVDYEQETEGDKDSPLPASLQEDIANIAQTLTEMVSEETKELVANAAEGKYPDEPDQPYGISTAGPAYGVPDCCAPLYRASGPDPDSTLTLYKASTDGYVSYETDDPLTTAPSGGYPTERTIRIPGTGVELFSANSGQ